MKIFKHFNQHEYARPCFICGLKKDGKTILVAMDGTEQENTEEAMQIHLDCINLQVKKRSDHCDLLIYQIVTDRHILEMIRRYEHKDKPKLLNENM